MAGAENKSEGAPKRPFLHGTLSFLLNHGAPIVFAALLWYVLWWGHSPELATVDAAMWHVSWVGVIALLYVALQARAVLAQPRTGVVHAMLETLISLFPSSWSAMPSWTGCAE